MLKETKENKYNTATLENKEDSSSKKSLEDFMDEVEILVKWKSSRRSTTRINSAERAVQLIGARVKNKPFEELWGIYLSNDLHVLGIRLINRGDVDNAIINPRMAYAPAFWLGAKHFILVHQHPSGNMAVSTGDVGVTERLKEAGRLLGVNLLDHIILNGDDPKDFISMAESEDWWEHE